MNLSIIIPVLNEELYLPTLLTLLSNQTFKNFEVLVVDGKSTDNTISEAEKFKNKLDLKIIKAPHKGVSFQRNLGAKSAKSELLLFLDADVDFKENFLEKIIEEFNIEKSGIGTVQSYPQDRNFGDTILSFLYNMYQNLTKSYEPEIYGWMILVKNNIHQEIAGFDEKIFFSEDSDYVKKIVKKGYKFQILKNTKIYFSSRRVKKEGRLEYHLKMIKYFIFLKLYDKYRAQEKITYSGGIFSKNN